jgi:hypothetical protein
MCAAGVRCSDREEAVAMAVTHRVNTQEVANFLIDAIGSDPIVEDIYLRVDKQIDAWIVVGPVSMEEEHHLYETAANLVRRYIETMPVNFHVLNPRHFLEEIDLRNDVVPRSAQRLQRCPSA